MRLKLLSIFVISFVIVLLIFVFKNYQSNLSKPTNQLNSNVNVDDYNDNSMSIFIDNDGKRIPQNYFSLDDSKTFYEIIVKLIEINEINNNIYGEFEYLYKYVDKKIKQRFLISSNEIKEFKTVVFYQNNPKLSRDGSVSGTLYEYNDIKKTFNAYLNKEMIISIRVKPENININQLSTEKKQLIRWLENQYFCNQEFMQILQGNGSNIFCTPLINSFKIINEN